MHVKLSTRSLALCCIAISMLISLSLQTDAAETHVSLLQRLDGHVFRDNVLFHIFSESPMHCAHFCLAEATCVMFSFTSAIARPNRCRGHSAIMKLGGSISRQDSDSRVFVLEERANALLWLDRNCSATADCPAATSECFAARCLCSPGYYYSVSQTACVISCAEANLQSQFLFYPESLLFAQELEYRRDMNQQQCLELCRADSRCRTVNLDNGDCTTHRATARDKPQQFFTSLGPATDHFQRMCA